MKNFLNLLLKLIAVLFIISGYLYVSWNYFIHPDLGIGKPASIWTFYIVLCGGAILSCLRIDLNFIDYVRYTVKWGSIILTSLIMMFIFWMAL